MFRGMYPHLVGSKKSWSDDAYDLPKEEKEIFLAKYYLEREEP